VLIPNSGRGGRWIASLGRIVRARLASPFVSQTLRPFLSMPSLEDLRTLAAMMASGEVTAVVDRVFPLADTVDAIEYVGAGHTRGKTVIVV
jgi:NADPH:quinone reductase-like Zn-dependent oxidoreductase